MHGLINRAIECFILDTYGRPVWLSTVSDAGLEDSTFEAMLHYDDDDTYRMLDAIAARQGKTRAAVLEDLGTYLVTHPTTRAIRRLLRFGGDTFADFLLSLDDLPDRARLAVPELEFPALELQEKGGGAFRLQVVSETPDVVFMLCGALRALADDYGALVLMDSSTNPEGGTIQMQLADVRFAEAKAFSLGGGAAPGGAGPGR